MVRTKVYSSFEADFSFKHVNTRVYEKNFLMARPNHFFKTKIEDDKFIKSDSKRINEQWEELNEVYHWLQDKGFIKNVSEMDSQEGMETFCLIAEKAFSWHTSSGKLFFLAQSKNDIEKRPLDKIADFYTAKGYQTVDFDKKCYLENALNLIPHTDKNLIFAGIRSGQGVGCYQHITHILQTPIITLEIVDPRIQSLSQCFLQIDAQNILYFSDAFSDESKIYLKNTFERAIDLPEEEVLNFALMSDLFEHNGERRALMQLGNSLTSKVLKKFDYKIIDINLSEFSRFDVGIKHLRTSLF